MHPGPPPAASAAWAYMLDVDGTLIDIAETPDAVHVDAELLALLRRLHDATGGAVALISGRAIADLEKRLGALRVPLAGQHGLERRDASGRISTHAAPPAAKDAIKKALLSMVTRHPALLLEDKGLTLALHYRRMPRLASYVHRAAARLVAEANAELADAGLEVQSGKCVVEIKPSGFDKGTAVLEYAAEPPFKGRTPVYIGDDLNDEHGFAEINALGGISIRVGKGSTCARYRLPDVASVRNWLARTLPSKAGRQLKGSR